MSESDDDAKKRRARHAERARIYRAARRRKLEEAWKATAATAITGADVAAVVDGPPSILLGHHIHRVAKWLDLLERDPHVSTLDKMRAFISALPALAKATESSEFRDRLDEIEARVAARPRT